MVHQIATSPTFGNLVHLLVLLNVITFSLQYRTAVSHPSPIANAPQTGGRKLTWICVMCSQSDEYKLVLSRIQSVFTV